MQVSFFEEFPIKSNLEKLKLVSWPTKVYLAAKSMKEFNKIKKKIKYRNKEFVYWPVLDKKEGYWISPFSRRKALLRIFKELKDKNTPVMLDLELPTRHNFWLYFWEMFSFLKNKRLIEQFIRDYSGQVYLAEYYPEGERKERILRLLGLHYENKRLKIIKILYHSLHNFDKEFLLRELKRGKEKFGDNYLIALGAIAAGINENEPLLSPAQLKQDLKLAQSLKIEEVIIFRLGGLNKRYLQALGSKL